MLDVRVILPYIWPLVILIPSLGPSSFYDDEMWYLVCGRIELCTLYTRSWIHFVLRLLYVFMYPQMPNQPPFLYSKLSFLPSWTIYTEGYHLASLLVYRGQEQPLFSLSDQVHLMVYLILLRGQVRKDTFWSLSCCTEAKYSLHFSSSASISAIW